MSKDQAVLIVDDQDNWREILEELIKDDFEVLVAKGLNDAIKIIQSREKHFHVVVTDMRLNDAEPGNKDGLKLIEYLNRQGDETKTIVVTGYATIDTAKRALSRLDAYDYIEKRPSDGSEFNYQEFQQIIKAAAREAEKKRNPIDIFVIMPFADKYHGTYTQMQKLSKEMGLICIRADEIPDPGPIMEQVKNYIDRAKIIIADLSGRNSNVYFELGMSEAKDKPIILLARKKSDVIKNLEGNRVIFYKETFDGVEKLITELKKQLGFIQNSKEKPRNQKYLDVRGIQKNCLTITSNNSSGEDVYKSIILPCVKNLKLDCRYVWDALKTPRATDITQIIKTNIQLADIIIADLSGNDSDVYYLSGFAFGLKRNPILLHNEQDKIPFDTNVLGKIPYAKNTEDERNDAKLELDKAIREVINQSTSTSIIATDEKESISMAPLPQKAVDFVLVTALEEERVAVLNKLQDYHKLPPSKNDIRSYFQAELPVIFPDKTTGSYQVIVLSLQEMGRVEAATATADAIRFWHPRYVLLTGIAGGLAAKNINLGDIIISNQIIDYELQKLTPDGPEIRWVAHPADPRLLGACKNLVTDSWQKLISTKRPGKGKPQFHFGPIASGDKVIAFGDVLKKYQITWPKLIGVEMEAGGVATAAFQSADSPGFFMIRCVSDLADEDKNSDDVKKWRLYACDAAAAYTIALLKSGPVPLS